MSPWNNWPRAVELLEINALFSIIVFFSFLYYNRICRPPPKQPPTLPKPHFTAGVKFSSWEPDRRDFVPGDTRFLHYEPLRDTSCVRVLMLGVTFDPRGALPLNGAMSPSSGTCHALFMSVTSVFIWAQCTVVDTFSIVAIGGSPTFTWCSFCCCCYCCCFDLFWLVYQQRKEKTCYICEHEPHRVDAKLDWNQI